MHRFAHRGEGGDPLLPSTNQLETETSDSQSETVNLASLFTVAAAVGWMTASPRAKRHEVLPQLAKAGRLADTAD